MLLRIAHRFPANAVAQDDAVAASGSGIAAHAFTPSRPEGRLRLLRDPAAVDDDAGGG
ncbi:hypothetical protein ACFVRD_45275 [Streptomyces sp. NPDC057908]|uniref:hypothetical protein n=1 Tax=unclassified Streptomyces TaxID=2593676 RepID=UPI0036CB94EB